MKIFFTIVAILSLIFFFWYEYVPRVHNDPIMNDTAKAIAEQREQEKNQAEMEQKLREMEQNLEKKLKEAEDKTEQSTSSKGVVPESSASSPIALTRSQNYVTGRNITFMIPNSMRRMVITIYDRNGRARKQYTLPNAFISVRAGERLNIYIQ